MGPEGHFNSDTFDGRSGFGARKSVRWRASDAAAVSYTHLDVYKRQVWQSIAAALDEAGPPATVTVRSGEGEWRTLTPGAEIKMLMVDRDAGFQSFLLRLSPGAMLPPHDHSILEECLLLEGDMLIGERAYRRGDYHAALPGSRHAPISTRNGGIVFIRSELRPEMLA